MANINFFKKENRKILTGTSRKKSFADFFKDTSKTKLSASLLSGIICALGAPRAQIIPLSKLADSLVFEVSLKKSAKDFFLEVPVSIFLFSFLKKFMLAISNIFSEGVFP